MWDGLTILPAKYVEYMTALSFHTIPEFMAVMVIGKTIGGFITYKGCNYLFANEANRGLVS